MKIEIPKTDIKEWKGIFPGKYSGNLWQTWNMDLERVLGRICLSGRGGVVRKSDSDFIFSVPLKFVKTKADGTSRYWMLSGILLGHSSDSTPTSAWAKDTISGSPTAGMVDMIVHGDTDHSDTNASDRLLVFVNHDTGGDISILNKVFGTDTSPYAWDTDWWTGPSSDGDLGQTVLNGTVDHPCAKLQTLVGFCDGPYFHTIDKNDVVAAKRLTFPLGFVGHCVYTSEDRFWIGVRHEREVDGRIIEWDGSSETYNKEYKIEGIPLLGWVKDGIPYFLNNFGQIMRYNGLAFEEVNRFPLIEQKIFFETNVSVGSVNVNRYGAVVDGDIVKIFITAPNTSFRVRSGIWIFNTKNFNLYHYQSIGGYVTDSDGQPDFGQGVIGFAGPLIKATGEVRIRYVTATDLIAGGNYYLAYSGTTKNAIFKFYFNGGSGNPSNRGYLITPYLTTDEIVAFWKSIWVKFKKFLHGDNKIVVKFRVDDPLMDSSANLPQCQITWLSSLTFSGVIPTGVKVGHEVEILAGTNAGCCFHILSFSNDTDGVPLVPNGLRTITVTLDETTPASDTSLALAGFNNFYKSEEISDTSIGNYNFPMVGADSDGNQLNNGENCQIKVELRGKSMEVEQLQVIAEPVVPAE